MAPVGIAKAAGSDGPSSYPISPDSVSSDAGSGAAERSAVTRSVAHRANAKAAVAKKTQILQTWDGIQVAGSNGVSVATGPKHVVEATGGNIRAFTKSTGAVPPK